MRKLILAITLIPTLGACTHDLANEPSVEQKIRLVKYNCARGDTLSISFSSSTSKDSAKNKIAIINGFNKKPIILKSQPTNIGFLYSNGKYTLKGNGEHATWTVGRMAPMNCWLGSKKAFDK